MQTSAGIASCPADVLVPSDPSCTCKNPILAIPYMKLFGTRSVSDCTMIGALDWGNWALSSAAVLQKFFPAGIYWGSHPFLFPLVSCNWNCGSTKIFPDPKIDSPSFVHCEAACSNRYLWTSKCTCAVRYNTREETQSSKEQSIKSWCHPAISHVCFVATWCLLVLVIQTPVQHYPYFISRKSAAGNPKHGVTSVTPAPTAWVISGVTQGNWRTEESPNQQIAVKGGRRWGISELLLWF